jgi:hypothetical protein
MVQVEHTTKTRNRYISIQKFQDAHLAELGLYGPNIMIQAYVINA